MQQNDNQFLVFMFDWCESPRGGMNDLVFITNSFAKAKDYILEHNGGDAIAQIYDTHTGITIAVDVDGTA